MAPVPSKLLTDAELVQKLLSLYGELFHLLQRGIPARFRSVVSADDLIQEVWVAAFRADRALIGDWNSWIRGAARNILMTALRAARRLKRGGEWSPLTALQRSRSLENLFTEVADRQRTPSREFSAIEASRAVQAALASLPEPQRTAIQLCHLQGLSRRQAAETMGRTEADVGYYIFSGLKRMRTLIGEVTSSETRDPFTF